MSCCEQKQNSATRNGQAPADVRNAAHSRRGSSAINRIDRAARRGNAVGGGGGGGASRLTKALIHASAHEAPPIQPIAKNHTTLTPDPSEAE